ncbi:hypothetical protein [Allofustis seminis]|uniref:hypothetical protein n=1 Tax=Allofustis seminis TaxID=166939 RepID=UPI0003652055|nr:hypothetical protein [Allofustis seminis]
MEKLSRQPKELLERIKISTLKLYEQKTIYPQMPLKQLEHFVAQAARKHKEVILQIEVEKTSTIEEIKGILQLVPQTGQIIVTSSNDNLIHLIYPSALRHIRIAS